MSKQLEISRVFDASKEEVFDAFTSGENLQQWWGPEGYDIEVKKFEFYPEGIFHFVLRHQSGSELWGKWIFKEIQEAHKLSVINCFSNEAGETVKAPEDPFGEDWPEQMVLDFEFYQDGDKCRIDMVSFPHRASEASEKIFIDSLDDMQKGFGETLDQLDVYLKK